MYGTPDRNIRILLVEDNPADVEYIRVSLQWRNGPTVDLDVATDLTSGIEKLEEAAVSPNRYDAVLLDLSLPESRGLETLRRVCYVTSAPVIVLSGTQDEKVALEAVAIGAQDYLIKGNSKGPAILRSVRYAIERAHMQEQVQHAQKLENLGVLAGGIAHDFNNLLQSIVAYATVALEDLEAGLPVFDDIEHIKNLAFRGAALSDQMLSYAGKRQFNVQALNLSQVARTTSRRFREVSSVYTRFEYDLGTHLPEVWGDTDQLGQALLNLVANAAESHRDNTGIIAIRTGCEAYDDADLLQIRTDHRLAPGTYAWIEVEDQGCGIRTEPLDKVFEPFVSTKASGRGLGLSAVEGIVRGHQGGIQLWSRPGSGTRVRLVFPTRESLVGDASVAAQDPVASQVSSANTILVADDEPHIRKWLVKFLDREGYDVVAAADGEEAIELFREHAHELLAVIMDQTMPKLSGAEAVGQIHAMNPNIPVFLISGWQESQAARELGGVQLAGFLQKPFKPDEILEKLDTLAR